MTKRMLTLVSAALIGGLLSWAAVAQMVVAKSTSIVGSSPTSWEEAAKNAVEEAGAQLRDTRVAQIEALDMRLEDGKVVEYRAQVKVQTK